MPRIYRPRASLLTSVFFSFVQLQLVGSRALGQSRAHTHAHVGDDTRSFSITREAAAPKKRFGR